MLKDKKVEISKKSLKRPILVKIGLIFAVIIVGIFSLVLFYNLTYSRVIFPHTYVGGVNLSGKTADEAKQILSQKIESNKNNDLKITFSGQSAALKLSDLNVIYNTQGSASLAWAVGRQGGFVKILQEQFKSVFSSNQESAVFTYDIPGLQKSIADIASKVDQPEVDATIAIKDSTPIVTPEKTGLRIDQVKSQISVLNAIGNFLPTPELALTGSEVKPKIDQATATQTLTDVNKIIAQDISIHTSKKDFTLKKEDIFGLLSFVPVQSGITKTWTLSVQTNSDAMTKYVATLAKDIDQDAKDAKYAIDSGKVQTFQLSQEGYKLDQSAAVKTISDAILNSQSKVTLDVKTVKPKVTDVASTNGIKELVGEATTTWTGSPNNRIHNITLGANNISGTVVNPGEEFSTINTIGEIDAASGFLQELVIKNGTQVVPDYGGGLCQVSTTLFRAALNSGLKITARTPHSFRVSYYEPPVGMDATIYDPAPDFKFVNDMDSPILIWAVVGSNSLTFQMYGTKDGRVVNLTAPVVGSYVAPGYPVYTETDTMDPGTIRQVEHAVRGATASFSYKVLDKKGQILEDQTFVSKYIPVPNSFLYGPGATIPPAGG